MWILLDIAIAVFVAANMVHLVTGEKAIGQLDYLCASFGGIILFACGLALLPIQLPFPPMFVLMAGGIIGCCGYHTYKELF